MLEYFFLGAEEDHFHFLEVRGLFQWAELCFDFTIPTQ
jgi:hypothetical protein